MAIVVIAQNLVDSSPSLGKGLRAKMEEKHSQGHCIETTQLNESFAEQNVELLGKPLSACHHLHLGIAQIAFTPPPPALKRALWGTFFRPDLSDFVKSPFWGYVSATKNPGKP